MKQNTIATYEMNRTNPSDPAIKSICREFNINETWLRTGNGDEMFVKLPRNETLAAQIQAFLRGGTDSFRERLVSLLLRLTPEQWDILEKYLLELTAAPVPAPTHVPSTELTLEQEADQFAAMAREQFLAEKRRESEASSAKESGAG